MDASARILHLVTTLYGQDAAEIYERVRLLIERFSPARPVSQTTLSHADAFLITYGDQVRQDDSSPLQSLAHFCRDHLTDIITAIHVLPFYPYSSDDGFSVIDYREVDPLLGSWEDLVESGSQFRLMFDAVINHVSARHEWFEKF
ncbi:MAG TPA: alpha-amylase family glycosyl hydrolase, partial [Acidobacteriota bacterium]